MALIKTDVSKERSASFIRVTRIGELRRTSAVTDKFPEDAILHSHRRENLKSYRRYRNLAFLPKSDVNYHQLNNKITVLAVIGSMFHHPHSDF
jgi:hypothetical protein